MTAPFYALVALPPTWEETRYDAPSRDAAREIVEAYVSTLFAAGAGILYLRVEICEACPECAETGRKGRGTCRTCSGDGVIDTETRIMWAPEAQAALDRLELPPRGMVLEG